MNLLIPKFLSSIFKLVSSCPKNSSKIGLDLLYSLKFLGVLLDKVRC